MGGRGGEVRGIEMRVVDRGKREGRKGEVGGERGGEGEGGGGGGGEVAGGGGFGGSGEVSAHHSADHPRPMRLIERLHRTILGESRRKFLF